MVIEIEVPKTHTCIARCKGGKTETGDLFDYQGPYDCRISSVILQGNKRCVFGCLGQGHCASVCPEGAIIISANRLPVIDPGKCKACGTCIKECPRQVLELIPRTHLVYLACRSLDRGEPVKNVCTVGCDACGTCVQVCPYQDAIRMLDNLPVMDFTKCTSCGICHKKCPTTSLIDRAPARPHAIISSQCDGCGECLKVCQFEAIKGEAGKRHNIIKENCNGCGRCFEVCPIKVITMMGALGYANKNG